MQIVKILCKAGYQTTVSDGGEIVAQSDGHMYSIMCHENGHIQFARRYKVPVAQITTLRLAAVHTMSEVYMAKVIVEKGSEDGTGFMVFSVETVCSSEKELKATIQQHMQTIDDAEQSQSQHADELMASQQQTVERKRIGFI